MDQNKNFDPAFKINILLTFLESYVINQDSLFRFIERFSHF